MKKILLLLRLLMLNVLSLSAQNIDGLSINVAKIAPAYIKFNDKIKTAEFNANTAYDNYQLRVRNDDNTLIIQYTGTGATVDEGLTITEGSRSHFFIISFLNDYDINKHKQLYYTFDDLKKLKQTIAAKQEKSSSNDKEEDKAAQEQIRANEEQERQKEIDKAEKQKQQALVAQQQELEAQKKKNAAEEKKAKEELAKAQAADLKKTKEQEAAIAKEKALAAEQKKITQQQLDEAAKQKLLDQKQKQLEAAQKEREKKEQEQLLAKQQLEALQAKQIAVEDEKKYTTLGLWKRYGQYGINLYEIPDDQKNWINGDFFIAADTIYNYEQAQLVLQKPARQIEASYGAFKEPITLKITDISFSGPFTYYKINIENNSKEDFLSGGIVMDIYDENKAHKQQMKCSYFTYIAFYPIIKPNTNQNVVFVTRTPVVEPSDDAIIYFNERRKAYGGSYIILSGSTLLKEQGKTDKLISPKKSSATKKKKGNKK